MEELFIELIKKAFPSLMESYNERISKLEKLVSDGQPMIDSKEAIEILKVNADTLLRYEKKSLINVYRKENGRKKWFMRSEVIALSKRDVKYKQNFN